MKAIRLFAVAGLTALSLGSSLGWGSTLSGSSARAVVGDTSVAVDINLDNSVAYAGVEFEIRYSASLLDLNRVENGARLSAVSDAVHNEYTSGRIAFVAFDMSGATLAPDSGQIVTIYFDVPSAAPICTTAIQIIGAAAVDENMAYDALDIFDGSVAILPEYLCGNVDNDPQYQVDLSDLIYLVNYLFLGGPEVPIPASADVNDCAGDVDLSDLIYLVNYLFLSGPAPCEYCGSKTDELMKSRFSANMQLEPKAVTDNTWRLDISAEVDGDIAGYQQEFVFDPERIRIDTVIAGTSAEAVKLYYSHSEGLLRMGLVDIDGAGVIPKGEPELVSVYYRVFENSADSTDQDFRSSKAIVVDRAGGKMPVSGLGHVNDPELPTRFDLEQNYPNPFNASTVIRFALPRTTHVTLDVINTLGQRVCRLLNTNRQAGYHEIVWDGTNEQGKTVASGVYFYRIKTGEYENSKKMMLLK